MAKATKSESPALMIVRLVDNYEGHQMGRSCCRSDSAKWAALRLAIRYGLRFDLDDFEVMAKPAAESGMSFAAHENHYSMACSRERTDYGPNRSACRAFEHWTKRKPFIVKTADCRSGFRIAIGTRFPWLGRPVTCTSFAEDGTYLTACSYREVPLGHLSSSKIEKRFKLTHDKLREANRAVTERMIADG